MLSDKFVKKKDLTSSLRPQSVEQEFARQRMFKRMQAEIDELQPPVHSGEKEKRKKRSPKKDGQNSPHQTSSSKSPGQSLSPNKESFFLGNRNFTAVHDKKVSLPEILSL